MMAILKQSKNIGIAISFFLFLFLVNPFNLNMYFGYAFVGLIFLKKQFLLKHLDSLFFLLLITSVIYALFYAFDPKGGVQYIIVHAIFPPTFYLLGKYIYVRLNGNKTYLFYFLAIIGILYSITPVLSVLINLRQGGFGQIDRSLPLFWNGQLVTATIMGSYYTLNMCIPSILLVRQEKRNWLFNMGAIFIFILSLACALRIGSRTQLFVFLIVLFLSLVYIIPKQSRKRNLATFFVFFIGLAFILRNISFDLDQDWLATFAGRMEKGGGDDIASGGGRSSRWIQSIEYIVLKPLGWDVHEFGHSHNMWLDVLRVSGVIPFFLLLGFSIKSFFILKSAVFRNKVNLAFNNQLIVYFISLNLVFMVEPIFEGVIEMFMLFCLLVGITVMYRNEQIENSKNLALASQVKKPVPIV